MEKLSPFGERTACCSNVCAECCRSWKCDSEWNGRSWKRSALKWPALRNGALRRERRFRVAEDLPYHLLAAEILRGLCRRTACGDPACGRTVRLTKAYGTPAASISENRTGSLAQSARLPAESPSGHSPRPRDD